MEIKCLSIYDGKIGVCIQFCSETIWIKKLTKIYIINKSIKIHDWKHKVNQYSNQGGIKPAAAKELIQLFNIYDTNVNTGNSALDLVIREKSLLCQKKGITLQFFGDGRHLSFMNESDIYSLLGNLLDNAIEAESKLSIQSKKIIKVNIRNTIGFISMNVENYFTGTIKLNDEGLPLTTKKNKSYHGYGIRSIQLILSKYEGSMKINITDDIFNMSILIPDGGHFKE